MKTGNKFSALMMVFGISAILYGVQLLFSVVGMSPGRWHTICLLGYGIICFTVNSLWLRRGKTVNLTVLMNGILSAIFLGIVFTQFGTGGGKQVAFTVAFCLFLTYYAVKLNLRPPKATQLILYLDISVVLIILLVIVINTMELSFQAAAPPLFRQPCGLPPSPEGKAFQRPPPTKFFVSPSLHRLVQNFGGGILWLCGLRSCSARK